MFNFKILYDCVDNIMAFPNIHKERKKEEDLLVKYSDLVVTNSRSLQEKLKLYNDKTILIPNACDFEHFNKNNLENLLKDLKEPIVGYFGAIAEWFDTSLVEFIAKQRPNVTFVFIGDTYGSNLKRLRNLDNILFLGERPYTELPKYLIGFDVCIIPFKLTPLVIDSHPIKIYEYLASGKPIVATDMPELHPMKHLCYISKGKEDFLDKLDEALKENDETMTSRRIGFAAKNTWDYRFNTMYTELNKIQNLVRK